MSRRVFFLQGSDRFNTEPANRYGERVFLFTSDLPSPLNPSGVATHGLQRMEELRFNPEEDYVALTGPVVPLVVFISALVATYGDHALRFLIFDARHGTYQERHFHIDSIVDSVFNPAHEPT